jgi:hypothetical protein
MFVDVPPFWGARGRTKTRTISFRGAGGKKGEPKIRYTKTS